MVYSILDIFTAIVCTREVIQLVNLAVLVQRGSSTCPAHILAAALLLDNLYRERCMTP